MADKLPELMDSAEQAVLAAVDKLSIPYEVITIDPTYADTVAFCERYCYPLDQSANTIVVASKKEPKQFAACVVLATTQLDVNRRVKSLLGVSKASFATAEEMKALTGMEVGGVTPFALPAGISLYVDERILQLEWIILGGGGRTKKIKISPEVFTKLGAQIVADLGLVRSAG
jgi:prolyl-tRNA editing enzyme YbaK/EbsC (Cys-tRNA(Pro) deacylase)